MEKAKFFLNNILDFEHYKSGYKGSYSGMSYGPAIKILNSQQVWQTLSEEEKKYVNNKMLADIEKDYLSIVKKAEGELYADDFDESIEFDIEKGTIKYVTEKEFIPRKGFMRYIMDDYFGENDFEPLGIESLIPNMDLLRCRNCGHIHHYLYNSDDLTYFSDEVSCVSCGHIGKVFDCGVVGDYDDCFSSTEDLYLDLYLYQYANEMVNDRIQSMNEFYKFKYGLTNLASLDVKDANDFLSNDEQIKLLIKAFYEKIYSKIKFDFRKMYRLCCSLSYLYPKSNNKFFIDVQDLDVYLNSVDKILKDDDISWLIDAFNGLIDAAFYVLYEINKCQYYLELEMVVSYLINEINNELITNVAFYSSGDCTSENLLKLIEQREKDYLYKTDIVNFVDLYVENIYAEFCDFYQKNNRDMNFFDCFLDVKFRSTKKSDNNNKPKSAMFDLLMGQEVSDVDCSKFYSIKDIDLMNGFEFEAFLTKLFDGLGYIVSLNSKTNDQGVDLILKKGTDVIAVQAKRYNGVVSNAAIQQVVAGATYYNCNKMMVVTNSYFTNPAINLASVNKVELWDREELIRVLNKVKLKIS